MDPTRSLFRRKCTPFVLLSAALSWFLPSSARQLLERRNRYYSNSSCLDSSLRLLFHEISIFWQLRILAPPLGLRRFMKGHHPGGAHSRLTASWNHSTTVITCRSSYSVTESHISTYQSRFTSTLLLSSHTGWSKVKTVVVWGLFFY